MADVDTVTTTNHFPCRISALRSDVRFDARLDSLCRALMDRFGGFRSSTLLLYRWAKAGVGSLSPSSLIRLPLVSTHCDIDSQGVCDVGDLVVLAPNSRATCPTP